MYEGKAVYKERENSLFLSYTDKDGVMNAVDFSEDLFVVKRTGEQEITVYAKKEGDSYIEVENEYGIMEIEITDVSLEYGKDNYKLSYCLKESDGEIFRFEWNLKKFS